MLSGERKRSLRAQAHHLKPIVLIGQHGLTDAVQIEIDRALVDHELIKVRFRGAERDDREAALEQVCAALACERVASIGATAVLYRKRREGDTPKRFNSK